MKKVALVFVLAVFVPSLVLAWLAVRSLRDQQFVLERQQSLLCQGVTDSLANKVENLLADRQRDFGFQVEQMLSGDQPAEVAKTFDEQLRANWPLADVGFVVTTAGQLVSPPSDGRAEARLFRANNSMFLANRESAEVYWNAARPPENKFSPAAAPESGNRLTRSSAQAASTLDSTEFARKSQQARAPLLRNVQPQQRIPAPPSKDEAENVPQNQPIQQFSKIAPAEAEFQQLIGDANEGTLARFVDNRLSVLFWYRSPRDPRYIFGAQLSLAHLSEQLRGLLQDFESSLQLDICVALLDDNARPVGLSHPGFKASWKHPFVSTEIGEELPHWEVAAYLLDPASLTQSAHILKLTLGLLIAVLVLAIAVGSWLIVSDLNRHLTLARQKTDFVSNVSHELKTPLTSIRMFSELLADQRVADPARQQSYLNIITAETARLTRLINNVLDFSRLERGEKKYNFRDCDLAALVHDAAESYRPHLEHDGYVFECSLPGNEVPVRADPDALAQVIVNLLSNAEKYAGESKEIVVRAGKREGPLPCAEVQVLDRGPGVPRGSEEKIFEKFYRAHDSLSSGIQGSGLGLTLARQIARAHGGDVVYEPREGGGSCFCLRLPLRYPNDENENPDR